jgi:hypothetical protein
MVPRSVSKGLQIVYERRRKLDLVVIDFDKDTGGMAFPSSVGIRAPIRTSWR